MILFMAVEYVLLLRGESDAMMLPHSYNVLICSRGIVRELSSH